MTEREALKLALEALEVNLGNWNAKKKAIPAIKEVLAQSEQKPPPWWSAVENILNEYGLHAIDFVADFKKAMKQAKQEPSELDVWKARALQAEAVIEKFMAQPEQHQDWCASLTQMLASMPPKPAPCNCKPQPVIDKSAAIRIATALGWTTQRTWIGLTGFEQKELMAMSARDAVFATEAKLKAKNA
jgi:DNA repair ATPase RecN